MGKIHQLPETLVNQIAAGEVVERPASVVKELLENAIDAGAKRIRIEVEDGGKRMIRVLDDGVGMNIEDLTLACLPHTTSKIDSFDDLKSLTTLGFRGEALSSIGAVSMMRVLTKPEGDAEGCEIMIRGGRIHPPQPAACPRGTLVEVRDLFYNVPARSKFLRRASTEFRVISDLIQGIALARPAVGIELRRDEKRVLNLPPVREASRRIDGLLGASVREGLRKVEGEIPGVKLRGWVSSPEESRSNTRSQYLIVQGRPIKDKSIRHALGEAYHTYLQKGRHPIAFLYLLAEPGEVDCNVHPTKSEVRFRDPQSVHSLVVTSVRTALEAERKPQKMRIPRREQARIAEAAPLWGPPEPSPGAEATAGGTTAAASAPAAASSDAPTEAMRAFGRTKPAPGVLDARRNFIQVHNTYVVEETADGIRVTDQHALHERILLHRLRTRIETGDLESQGALVPLTFPISAGEMAVATDRASALRKLGYVIEPFGEAELVVRSFPAILEKADHEEIVRDALRRLETKGTKTVGEEIVDDILRQMACHGAVTAGMRLRPDEIAELLDAEKEVTGSFACAHGRPTNLTLTLSDLERQFGRK